MGRACRYWRISYGRKENLGDVECALNNPVLTLQLGILEKWLGLMQNSKGMCQGGKPGTGKSYTDVFYVAPPTPVGAWSMASGLWQRIEYYFPIHIDTRPHE